MLYLNQWIGVCVFTFQSYTLFQIKIRNADVGDVWADGNFRSHEFVNRNYRPPPSDKNISLNIIQQILIYSNWWIELKRKT